MKKFWEGDGPCSARSMVKCKHALKELRWPAFFILHGSCDGMLLYSSVFLYEMRLPWRVAAEQGETFLRSALFCFVSG